MGRGNRGGGGGRHNKGNNRSDRKRKGKEISDEWKAAPSSERHDAFTTPAVNEKYILF